MTSSPGSSYGLEDTLKAILPEGKFTGPLPPVDLWNPPRSSDIGMEIRADGSWWHDGAPIRRERLVKLFARILRKDADGTTWLVTPYEKVIVHVADAAFLGVDVVRSGPPGPAQVLTFTTNLGDLVTAGPQTPLRVEQPGDPPGPQPYLNVRGRLEAKLTRPVFYQLVDWAEAAPHAPGTLGVWSAGQFCPIGRMV